MEPSRQEPHGARLKRNVEPSPEEPPSLNRSSVSIETLKAIADAFNAHDLSAIMEFFADDCSLDMPRGAGPLGAALYLQSGRASGTSGTLQGSPRRPLQR